MIRGDLLPTEGAFERARADLQSTREGNTYNLYYEQYVQGDVVTQEELERKREDATRRVIEDTILYGFR